MRAGREDEGNLHLELEIAALASLVRAATDMHRLDPLSMNVPQVEIRAAEQLKESSALLKIALINRERSDIAFPDEPRPAKDRRSLVWQTTELTNTLVINMHAANDAKYSYSKWKDSILTSLQSATLCGANIICFGEFDYPPRFPDKKAEVIDYEKLFESEIIDIIDRADQPIFLFAGSSHFCQVFGAKLPEFSAENVGRIFYNRSLIDGMWKPEDKNPLHIKKITPASKIGERLSRCKGIDISTFKTVFGNILVLICADAYDPTIVLEVFSHSALEDERADIILVPAYNMSPKFERMCQLLSLLSDSVVVMLDVCSETTGRREKRTSEVWNCGWAPEESNGLSTIQQTKLDGIGMLGTCALNMDLARDFRSRFGSENYMPTFAGARRIVRG